MIKSTVRYCFTIILTMCVIMFTTAAFADPSGPTDRVYEGLWLWPASNGSRNVTSHIGRRSGVGSSEHHGIDIGNVGYDTVVWAARAGMAVNCGYNSLRGNYVIVDHGDGYYSEYQHLSSISFSGSKWVNAGEELGITGNTGDSYGAHLHFEIAYCTKGGGYVSEYGNTWNGASGWGNENWSVLNPEKQNYTYDRNQLNKYPFEELYNERAVVKGRGERSFYNIKKYPYDSDDADDITVGTYSTEEFTIDRAVKNKYGNIWFHAIKKGNSSIDGYIWSGGVNWIRDDRQISWENNSMNGARIKAGNGYEVTGTIRSTNPMTKIEAYVILNGIAGPFAPVQTVTFNTNEYSYSLGNSPINTGIKFSGYKTAGDYTFRLVITYKNKIGTSTGQYTLDTPFSISSETSSISTTSGKWVYQVVTSDGVNIRKQPGLSAEKKIAIFPPTTFTVSEKTTADGYTWGKGISSNGYDGWIVVDNSWTKLISSTVDSTAPTITNVKVYDVTSSGYTVSCSVSDNVGVTRVAFPTWTTNNGQDDLFSDWGNKALGTISNGTATYRVNTKDHNNETGCTYITHIYAYDAAGNTGHVNQSNYGVLQVEVPAPTVKTTGIQLDKSTVNVDLGSSGDKSFLLKATVSPANATNKTVHWWSSNQTVARVNDTGLVTPTSVGSAVITAMTESGGYQATCTVNVSTWANGITINPKEVVLNLTEKQTVKLSAAVSPNNATNKNVKWASANPSVASVSENGLVTPVSEGTTEITCKALDPSGVSASCKVVVEKKKNTIKLNPEKLTIEGWDSGEIYASVQMIDGSTPRLKWSWSNRYGGGLILHGRSTPNEDNKYYCWVDAYDGVTGKAFPGEYVITCSTEDGSASATCIVTVHIEPVSAITLSTTSIDLQKDETAIIQATISPSNSTRKWVEWKSSDKSVATVSSGGVVKAINPGKAVITCTATDGSGLSASCIVTVAGPVPVSSIKMNRSVYEFGDASEGNIELTATLSPDNASNKSISWSSSNTHVATVSDGIVTPNAPGYARITCESVDGPKGVCDIVVHAEKIRKLPSSLKIIEAETFFGTALREVMIPDGVTSIESKAFANCGQLVLVDLPSSVSSIASDAFSGSNVAIVCSGACYATEYADSMRIPYVIGSMPGEVIISTDSTTLLTGQSATLQARVLPNDAPKAVRWSIIDGGDIATIKSNGNKCTLTAVEAGYVTVSGTAINNTTGTIDITIIDHPTGFGIMFDANGGSVSTGSWSADFDVPLGTLPVPTREYYSFDGWYTQADGGTEVKADTVFNDYFMGDITLYAHWTRKVCTITYDANGGSCGTSSKSMNQGDAIGTLPTATRNYYTFDGWYTQASGGTKVAATTVFSSDNKLYAHWTRKTCTITFNANGGSCGTASKTMNQGDAIGTLPTATRDYYNFDGWYTQVSGGTKAATTTVYSSNTTLYAHWSLNGFGSWGAWSTIAVTGNNNRQVETKTEQVQTGTRTIYNYNRFLYWYREKGYYQASYGSNWATSKGYSGSWQYVSTESRYPVDHTTDGQNVYNGEWRDGNHWWYNETITTEPIYSNVTYYRYRDRVK